MRINVDDNILASLFGPRGGESLLFQNPQPQQSQQATANDPTAQNPKAPYDPASGPLGSLFNNADWSKFGSSIADGQYGGPANTGDAGAPPTPKAPAPPANLTDPTMDAAAKKNN